MVFTFRVPTVGLLALSAMGLGACAGNGMGLDANGRPLVPGGPTGGVLAANSASIQQNVFTPICSVCHAGASAPQGLRLDAANSYVLLVGVPSTEVPTVLRVKPGDPDNSYIIQKLEGHAAVGAQMPFGGPPLPAATIAVIRQWISDGAARAAAASHSFAVSTVVPARDDLLLEAPSHIVIELSAELDETRIDESSVTLERDRPEEAGAVATAVPVRLAVPVGNPRGLMVSPLTPLPNGHYRVIVNGPPATGLSSLSGERLRGSSVRPQADDVITNFDLARPQ